MPRLSWVLVGYLYRYSRSFIDCVLKPIDHYEQLIHVEYSSHDDCIIFLSLGKPKYIKTIFHSSGNIVSIEHDSLDFPTDRNYSAKRSLGLVFKGYNHSHNITIGAFFIGSLSTHEYFITNRFIISFGFGLNDQAMWRKNNLAAVEYSSCLILYGRSILR